MMFERYRWYRKWRGGTWYYNRYWFDAGMVCIVRWERRFLGYVGGPVTTITEEKYCER
jgi:hypothetical protein